jgi:hypothetical protein
VSTLWRARPLDSSKATTLTCFPLDSQTFQALNALNVQRRVILSGTPIQNDLSEYFSLLNFANPEYLGTRADFRKNFELKILRGRDADASEKERMESDAKLKELGGLVSKFIIRRTNDLLSKYCKCAVTRETSAYSCPPVLFQCRSSMSMWCFAVSVLYRRLCTGCLSPRQKSKNYCVEWDLNRSKQSTFYKSFATIRACSICPTTYPAVRKFCQLIISTERAAPVDMWIVPFPGSLWCSNGKSIQSYALCVTLLS